MWTRHLDVALIAELDVDNQEANCQHDAEHRAARQNDVDREIHLAVLNNAKRSVLGREAANLEAELYN